MKKLLCGIVLLSLSLQLCASSTKTLQIQGTSIQFNCISDLDAIIAGVPTTITSFTMDLTNACNSLEAAAVAYEDAAAASSDFQVQGDYYYNAAQAYLAACKLVTNTTEYIGTIGAVQDITYIQSYRSNALQAFHESFEAYLTVCLQNLNTPLAKSVAANAVLAFADFLAAVQTDVKEQQNIIQTLAQTSQNFSSYMTCDPTSWYPLQLPNEDFSNCQYARLVLPNDFSIYTQPMQSIENNGLGQNPIHNNFSTDSVGLRYAFGFPAAIPDVPNLQVSGQASPGQHILYEYPTGGQGAHNQGLLSCSGDNNTLPGSYVSNLIVGSSSQPLFDMNSLGRTLSSYSQIVDPYSVNDPHADPSIINIIPQPQYIYTTPAPTAVQSLHDAVRDYMYSADISKMDSYLYNAYFNTTALQVYPADILPAIRRMSLARMNALQCYEGAIIKIVVGLTGNTSMSPAAWANLSLQQQSSALNAAECIAIILPMYLAVIKQILNYDIPLFNSLSSLVQSNAANITASLSASNQNATQQPSGQNTQQATTPAMQQAQAAYQQAQAQQSINTQKEEQLVVNQQTAAQQVAQAAASVTQAQASYKQAQQLADEAAGEISSPEVGSATSDVQQAATAAYQATKAAAAQAQAAYQQAQQAQAAAQTAATAGDIQTATNQAQAAATAATNAANQATIAGTNQYNTQQEVQQAIVQSQQKVQQAAEHAADVTKQIAANEQAIAQQQAANVVIADSIVAQRCKDVLASVTASAQKIIDLATQADQASTVVAGQASAINAAIAQIQAVIPSNISPEQFIALPKALQSVATNIVFLPQQVQTLVPAIVSNIQQLKTFAQQAQQVVQNAAQATDNDTSNKAYDAMTALTNQTLSYPQLLATQESNLLNLFNTATTNLQAFLAAQPQAPSTPVAPAPSAPVAPALVQPVAPAPSTPVAPAPVQPVAPVVQPAAPVAPVTPPSVPATQAKSATPVLQVSSVQLATPPNQSTQVVSPIKPAASVPVVKAKVVAQPVSVDMPAKPATQEQKNVQAPVKKQIKSTASLQGRSGIQNMVANLFALYEKNNMSE